MAFQFSHVLGIAVENQVIAREHRGGFPRALPSTISTSDRSLSMASEGEKRISYAIGSRHESG
jgi:hypothetical protein